MKKTLTLSLFLIIILFAFGCLNAPSQAEKWGEFNQDEDPDVTYVVRIKGLIKSGSGVVIASNDIYSLILTTYHVISNSMKGFPFEIQVFNRSLTSYDTYMADSSNVIAIDEWKDLALIELIVPNLNSIELFPYTRRLLPNYPLTKVGCQGARVTSIANGYLLEKNGKRGYVSTTKVNYGDSGGAIVYQSMLVGIIRAMDGYRNCYFISYKEIHEFLTNN